MHADRLGGDADARRVALPVKVNLIGEHTDYNDGFVFPMAIPFVTAAAVSLRPDRRAVGHSTRFGTTEFEIDNEPTTTDGWGRYLHGMARMLADHGVEVGGFDVTVVSDIPGSSLKSSAALDMASGMAITALGGTTISPGPTRPPRTAGRSTRSSAFPQGLWTSSSPPQGFGARQPSSTAAHSNCARLRCRTPFVSSCSTPVPVAVSSTPSTRIAGPRKCERVAAVLGVEALRGDVSPCAGRKDRC